MIPVAHEARLTLERNTDNDAASCSLLCWAGPHGADIRVETGGANHTFVVSDQWCTDRGELTFTPGGTDYCPLGAGPTTIAHADVGTTCDVNNCAGIVFEVTVTPPADQSWINGKTITDVTPSAVSLDPGATSFTWGISPALPSGLSFDTATGKISGQPSAVHTQTTYTLTATDNHGNHGSATFKATVAAAVVTVATVSDQTWTSGAPITPVNPSASDTNGETTFTWSIAPALPSAVTLNTSSGQISGTPAASHAITSYTLTATDSTGAAGTKTFNITVS